MNKSSRLILVDSKVLPEVIIKVLKVKTLLANKEEKSSASACKRVGISRSAYYKYRDSVFFYEEGLHSKIITIFTKLKDEPGVLSSVLIALHKLHANILTVNQSIPIDQVASVTIALRLSGVSNEINEIKSQISTLYGVIEVKIISGE